MINKNKARERVIGLNKEVEKLDRNDDDHDSLLTTNVGCRGLFDRGQVIGCPPPFPQPTTFRIVTRLMLPALPTGRSATSSMAISIFVPIKGPKQGLRRGEYTQPA